MIAPWSECGSVNSFRVGESGDRSGCGLVIDFDFEVDAADLAMDSPSSWMGGRSTGSSELLIDNDGLSVAWGL